MGLFSRRNSPADTAEPQRGSATVGNWTNRFWNRNLVPPRAKEKGSHPVISHPRPLSQVSYGTSFYDIETRIRLPPTPPGPLVNALQLRFTPPTSPETPSTARLVVSTGDVAKARRSGFRRRNVEVSTAIPDRNAEDSFYQPAGQAAAPIFVVPLKTGDVQPDPVVVVPPRRQQSVKPQLTVATDQRQAAKLRKPKTSSHPRISGPQPLPIRSVPPMPVSGYPRRPYTGVNQANQVPPPPYLVPFPTQAPYQSCEVPPSSFRPMYQSISPPGLGGRAVYTRHNRQATYGGRPGRADPSNALRTAGIQEKPHSDVSVQYVLAEDIRRSQFAEAVGGHGRWEGRSHQPLVNPKAKAAATKTRVEQWRRGVDSSTRKGSTKGTFLISPKISAVSFKPFKFFGWGRTNQV